MYSEIVKSVCTFGAYQQMLHLYALSAAVEKPIRSYCPPTSKNELMSEPFSRKVYGRQVKKTKSVEITLMWTMTNIPKCNTDFLPNHFVILKSKDCDDSLNIDSEDEFPSLPTPSPKCSTPTNISNVSQNLQSDSLDNKTCDSPAYCSDISGIELVESQKDENTDSSFKNNLGDSHQKDEITDASSSNVDDSIQKDDSAKPLAHIELENNFVELDTAIDILKSKENILDSVPPGPKENVYFLVSNKKNLERRNSRKKSEFFDDCGIWSSKSSSPTMHYVYYNDNYKKVYLRNDKCCIQKQVNKKQTYVPLEPQPSLDEVITVHRVYSNLKNDLSYKRRVTWISKGPTDLITCTQEKALYEYLGKYPGPSVHGKAKNSEREYARCPSHVLETIATKAKLSNPQNVYNDMVNNVL